ncbi:MAG: type II toxin-antitoxin system RatA family toxin [Pseudomonadales bacterium]
MPEIRRSALLPLPVARVFDVVGDVARYPEFLPWCRNATVLDRNDAELVAELELDARGIHQRFTTRNVMQPFERIELHLVSGPFRTFEGVWHFRSLGADEGCKVELDLRFELAGVRALFGRALSGVFIEAADQMVDAFSQRATDLHARP